MGKLIPTDIEIFGYRNVEIEPKPTDITKDKDPNLKWCDFRVQVDLSKYLIIDLGHGRQIRIKFYANKTDIGE